MEEFGKGAGIFGSSGGYGRRGCFDGVYTDDFLPQLFEYFQRNAPELKLVLHRMSFSEGTKALKGNKIDLWLTLQLGWEGAGNFCEMQLIRR